MGRACKWFIIYIYILSYALYIILNILFSRPGILVLVDDVDWELLDQDKYILNENDSIAFISTLHGG